MNTHEPKRHSMTGRTHTDESKEKMRLAKLGKRLSDDHKAKISESKTGVYRDTFSDEWIENLSKAKSGDKNPMSGKHHSDETKKKISEQKIGKPRTPETIAKIAESKRIKSSEKMACMHCGKSVATNMMKRWHGDKCKMNLTTGK